MTRKNWRHALGIGAAIVLADRVVSALYRGLPLDGKYAVLTLATILLTLFFGWALRRAWRI